MKNDDKKQRDELIKIQSKKKFANQRKLIIKPNVICFVVEFVLFIILMIMDKPAVIFDNTSILFSIMLIIMMMVPLISIIIILFATSTAHLLITFSLNQLCVLPLIVAYFLKYEELKNCSSYHMLIFYFLYMIVFLAMTTVQFNIKAKFTTLEEK